MNTRKFQIFSEASTYARNLALTMSKTTTLLRVGSEWSVSVYLPVSKGSKNQIKTAIQDPRRAMTTKMLPNPYLYESPDLYSYEEEEEDEDDEEEEEEFDIDGYAESMREEYEEKAAYMQDYARSENSGWYYPRSDGSHIDNIYMGDS